MQEQVGESKLKQWGYFREIRLTQGPPEEDEAIKAFMAKKTAGVGAMTVKEEDFAK